ncbi:pyridoxal-phosphate dependent enzyme [[Eubacterium] cellulosolvens]
MLKSQVGRTPLVRAKKLEKELGISKIFLKLEGNNPSGHREDRLAYLLIRDALSRGNDTICMGTYGTVGGSLSYLAQYYDVNCIFYVPNKNKILRKSLMTPNVKIIEYGRTYEDCVIESRHVSEENDWYNANPGLENNIMNMYAFSYIAKELSTQTGEKIDTVFCPTGNGSSISGLHLGFKELWVDEDIEYLPKILAVSTDHGNAIIESYKTGSRNILTLSRKDVRESKYNRHLVNWKCFNGQDALNAIHDTNGWAIGITDEELLTYYQRFKTIEKIKITRANSYSIAAVFKAVSANDIADGTHIIILPDGKVDLDIRVMNKTDLRISYNEFLTKLDTWLIQYTDPREEIEEAVKDAFENGFVVCAYDRGVLVGIVIISTSKYDVFFPKYHLSYIATKSNIRGMGIATQLIQKVIELTEGNFSLHVEIDNKKAIRLYEKMGLKRKYYRMFYKGGVIENGTPNKH